MVGVLLREISEKRRQGCIGTSERFCSSPIRARSASGRDSTARLRDREPNGPGGLRC